MKNFPNQLASLEKLTAALSTADDLLGAGGSLGGNANEFGEELGIAGVLGGTATSNAASARGLRAFFAEAGLIGPGPDWDTITELGSELVAAIDDAPSRNAFWRVAMLQLELDGSHPYRILLRLIADRPGVESYKLLLVLEAADDSDAEYYRILGLSDLSKPDLLERLGISEQQAANAIKVIPRIALQVGDIRRVNHRNYIDSAPSVVTEDIPLAASREIYEQSDIQTPNAVDAEEIAPIPDYTGATPIAGDLAAAVAIRQRRTIIHQRTVMSIAYVLQDDGYALFRHPYDCLAFKATTGSILIEVKTLDGSRSDERYQTEKALGQIRGYNFYNVPEEMKAPSMVELIAFSSRHSPSTIAFLADNSVHTAWYESSAWYVSDLHGNISDLLPEQLFAA